MLMQEKCCGVVVPSSYITPAPRAPPTCDNVGTPKCIVNIKFVLGIAESSLGRGRKRGRKRGGEGEGGGPTNCFLYIFCNSSFNSVFTEIFPPLGIEDSIRGLGCTITNFCNSVQWLQFDPPLAIALVNVFLKSVNNRGQVIAARLRGVNKLVTWCGERERERERERKREKEREEGVEINGWWHDMMENNNKLFKIQLTIILLLGIFNELALLLQLWTHTHTAPMWKTDFSGTMSFSERDQSLMLGDR